MTADVTVVIPVWNRADLLRKLLASISSQTYVPQEVIVIDNGSTDDAAEAAQRWGARVVSMGRNRGFAAAVNCGIDQSATGWVAIVNSDVELRADWLQHLLLAATETNAWFAAGKILSALNPSQIDGTWDLVAKSGCAWRAGYGRPDSPLFSTRRTIAMCSATAALYRKDLFARIGNFAESYESYLEDVDLSLRCVARGFEGIYEPAASCLHHGTASSGLWSATVTYLTARNQEFLLRGHFSLQMRREWRWKITIGRLVWGLVALRHGQFRAWVKGKRDGFRETTPVCSSTPEFRQAIAYSEREIYALQRRTGMDLYWRLYFLITGAESE